MGVLVYSFGFTVYGRGCRAEGLGLGIWGEKGVGRIYFGVNGQLFFGSGSKISNVGLGV